MVGRLVRRFAAVNHCPPSPTLAHLRPLSHIRYFEFCTSNKWGCAARIGNLKAVALSSEAPLELYDLSVDIGETNDLALSQPDLLAPLAACLEAQHRDSPQFPRGDGNCTTSR